MAEVDAEEYRSRDLTRHQQRELQSVHPEVKVPQPADLAGTGG